MTPDTIAQSLQQAGIQTPPILQILDREPDPLYGFSVDAASAIAMLDRLRAATEQTGLYPVLIADEHGILADSEGYPPPNEAIAEAARLNAARWLERQTAEAMEHAEPGEWPDDAEPSHEFAAPFEMGTGNPRNDLAIALLPTRNPWEAAAYLQFAAVNYDIEPLQHVAVHKYWFDKYGAELATCGGDFIELRVARPPTTREAALQLAREQYGYCIDIVDQGTDSIEALAAILLNGTVWFFWWD